MPLNLARRAKLLDLVPYGLVATRKWLLRAGMSRSALDNQIKSGQLSSLHLGVYVRPGTRLVWQGVVCSLERMGTDLVVGGTTALEEQGRAPELPLSGRRSIQLRGLDPLPPWVNGLDVPETFRRKSTAWLTDSATDDAAEGQPQPPFLTTATPWGDGFRTIWISTPERALFELLKDVPQGVSFERAERFLEGLSDLSPRRLELLLQHTCSVKIRRLFFWLAERQGHPWARALRPDDFDLGRGKLALAKGGRFVSRYGITVPASMHG